MDDFPASWNLVKRSIPPLAAYAASRLHSAWQAGKRAASAIDRDSSVPVTWKGNRMPPVKYSTRMRPRYRRSYRRKGMRRVMRRTRSSGYRRVVRMTNYYTITTAAATGLATLATNVSAAGIKTDDLTALYRLYRVRKVVLYLFPRLDIDNGNFASVTTMVSAACDPEGITGNPADIKQVAAYDNSHQKVLTGSNIFKYTFSPKAVNTVDVGGVATAAGSYATNPWLQMNATGLSVPHRSLLLALQHSPYPAGTPTVTQSFDYYFEWHLDLKGLA